MKEKLLLFDGGFQIGGAIVPGTLKIALQDEDWLFEDNMKGSIKFIKPPTWFYSEPEGKIDYNTGEFVLPFCKSNRYDILKNKIILQVIKEKIEFVRVDYAKTFSFVWGSVSESEISCDIRIARPFYRVWLGDENYFIYSLGPSVPAGAALYLNGLLPWDLVCYNTDFHNEFLVCETITDINNLISRWCFKNKIDPQSNTSKCIINLNSGIGSGGRWNEQEAPEPWLVEPAPQINADMITTGQRTLRADFSLGVGKTIINFVQGEGSLDEI
jgi:hypothetical protein